MPKVDVKGVREKCNVMNDAWFEGAKAVDFNGISQADFQTEIEAAAADDAAIADLEVELKMKRDVRDDKYFALDQNRSKVGLGVAGSPDYGNDSPLYGAMGFVRYAVRCAEKLCFSVRTPKDFAAPPPLFDAARIGGIAAEFSLGLTEKHSSSARRRAKP